MQYNRVRISDSRFTEQFCLLVDHLKQFFVKFANQNFPSVRIFVFGENTYGCWNVAKIEIFIISFIFMLYEVLLWLYISYLCHMFYYMFILYSYLYVYYMFSNFVIFLFHIYFMYMICLFLFLYYLILNLCDDVFIFIICTKLL